jgi:serine/threonine protein kinase
VDPWNSARFSTMVDPWKALHLPSLLHHMSLLNFRGVVLSLDEKCPLLIVTELADCSLQQWLNTLENPLTAAQVVVVDLWLQLSQALSFLHSQSPPIVAVVHRDIKPDNVLGFKNAGP